MAQTDSDEKGGIEAPAPPAYQYPSSGRLTDAETIGALGPVHPENGSPWADNMDRGKVVERVFQDVFQPAEFAASDEAAFPWTAEYHSTWLSRTEAADLLNRFPELDHCDFYPNRVANAVRALPENARVSVGREQTPVIYIWTGRPAMTGILRDAAKWNLSLGVVESFPATATGEEPCRFGGQPGGKWVVVRAGWTQETRPVGETADATAGGD